MNFNLIPKCRRSQSWILLSDCNNIFWTGTPPPFSYIFIMVKNTFKVFLFWFCFVTSRGKLDVSQQWSNWSVHMPHICGQWMQTFFILKIFSASLLFNGLSSFTWDWDFDLSPQSCTCNNALSGIPGTTICWWSDLPKSSRVVNSFKTRPIIHWDSSGRGVMI